MRFESYQNKIKTFLMFVSSVVLLGLITLEAVNNANQLNLIYELQDENAEVKSKLKESDMQISELMIQNQELRDEIAREHEESARGSVRTLNFTVTAYDLSGCGKTPGDYGYGVTASGVNLEGHTLESARAIAVDPSVIPIGSQVRINFEDESWRHLDGIYTAIDTGGAIVGNRIDLYMGENANSECRKFGVRQAQVEIL